jgi:spore maturation protein CgeB
MPPERLGKVVYGDGLREIYNSTKVNIDINRVVIRNGFTQRVFDALACGAFLITNAKQVVADHFETSGSQREIVTFKNADELADLVRYYLTHENERMEIARRGYRKVLTSHTYDHRIAEIFNTLSALYEFTGSTTLNLL